MAELSRKRPSPPHGQDYGQKYARTEYGGYGQQGPYGAFEQRGLLPPGSQPALDNVISNYFTIELTGPLRVWVYPVSADSFSDIGRRLRQRFINAYIRQVAFPGDELKTYNDKIISDVTSVITAVEIPQERLVETEIVIDRLTRRLKLLAPRVVDLQSNMDLAQPNAIESSVYNLILQKCLRKFLDRSPRGYFERVASSDLRRDLAEGVRLFRGYSASISIKGFVLGRGLVLNIDPLSRVIGLDSVLAEMGRSIGARTFSNLSSQDKNRLRRLLIGKSIHTRYNSKPYVIEDIDFNKNPFDYRFEFERRGGDVIMISPAEYLAQYQYETFVDSRGTRKQESVRITERTQPLIRTRGRGKRSIYLVPEVCCFIEVPKKIKDELPKVCSIAPTARFKLMTRLCQLVSGEGAARKVLESFNIRINPQPTQVRARQLTGLPPFDMWGRSISLEKAWGPQTKDLRFPPVGLEMMYVDSVFIVTEPGNEQVVTRLLDDCGNMFNQWNSPLKLPANHMRYTISVPEGADPYAALDSHPAMKQYLNKANSSPQHIHSLVLGVLYGRDHPDKYRRIREFCGERGIIEQCVNGEKFTNARAQMVVKANTAKQVLNKLGYLVWQADFSTIFASQLAVPALQGTFRVMFIGIDVHHARRVFDDESNRYRQRRSLGAFVAFMYELKKDQKRPASFKVYSDVVAKAARSEIICRNIGASEGGSSSSGEESEREDDLEAPSVTESNALQNFVEAAMRSARFYPHMIVVYRDGVSDSQLEQTRTEEVAQVKRGIENIRARLNMPYSGKVAFTVIQKNITTKFGLDPSRSQQQVGNLPSGTIVDGDVRDIVYHDWFLVSAREREERGQAASTVKPVRYIELLNESGEFPLNMTNEQFQQGTYALHGIYPNWTDFVKLPVVTQCAHKFAKTFGDIDLLQPVIHERLKSTLFFL